MNYEIFLLLIVTIVGLEAMSQPFNNEWIDYNKTYYKFKIATTGLYRITHAQLTTIGWQNAPAEQFQLWRNGEEVPMYTTSQTGALLTNGYLEFWAVRNDGKPDKVLYREEDYQLNHRYSLLTDSASFFLTLNSGANKRLVPVPNNIIPGSTPDPYFMHTTGKYWNEAFSQGRYEIAGENLFSSSYDIGEGFSSPTIDSGQVASTVLSNLFPYTGASAPNATIRVNATSSQPYYRRQFRVTINNDSILSSDLDFFTYAKVSETFPSVKLATGSATIEIKNFASAVKGRMSVAIAEITYPRIFNFGGTVNFPFQLAANPAGNYLEITNFNGGSVAPVLYDLTNGARYVADNSTASILKFALQPSNIAREMLLVSQQSANIIATPAMQQRRFVNYEEAANKGNYLIITAQALLNGSNGSRPVDNYVAYRSSIAGGGYDAKVCMIDQLIDQFAFGIKMHPLSIRNFLRWTRNKYETPVKYVLLIGKGVHYNAFRNNQHSPSIDLLCFVPSFGQPASDNLLAADPGPYEVPQTPIGRISAVRGDEITDYLNKVIEHEQEQVTQSPFIKDKAWHKNVMHVVGGSDQELTNLLLSSMFGFKTIITGPLFGGNVVTFSKTTAATVEEATSAYIQSLFQEGLGMLTYFGHSSATVLEFNLENPNSYNNQGKYPVVTLLGCNAGNFYNFNGIRLLTKETISEKFVLTANRGSIATMASTHLGLPQYLDILNSHSYTALGITAYGKSLGEAMIETSKRMYQEFPHDFYARFHTEQSTLHGDPAIKLFTAQKPDYAIEEPLVKINPSFISVAEASFKVNARFFNLGKALTNKMVVEVKRTYPDNSTEVIHRDSIRGTLYQDSVVYAIPIISTRDKGLNKITVTLDPDNRIEELFETNNSVTKEFHIFDDEIRPAYPANFAIVNKQNIKLEASIANAFSPLRNYMMELDTTTFFNSPIKVLKTVSSTGGIVSFDPGITFLDSTVYYWRVAPEPTSGPPAWQGFSFIYLPNSEVGFNQSHFYQQTMATPDRMTLDSASRLWNYNQVINNLFIRTGTYISSGVSQEAGFTVALNGVSPINLCNYFSTLVFNIIHPVHFTAVRNQVIRPSAYTGAEPVNPYTLGDGLYGSTSPIRSADGRSTPFNFEFRYTDAASRKKAMDFMRDFIPDGYYVVVRNFTLDPNSYPAWPDAWTSEWAADEATNGPGESLSQYFKNVGFEGVDSFYRARPFGLVYKKNDPNFKAKWIVGEGVYDNPTISVDCPSPDTLGYIYSPAFGRAKAWKQLKWSGKSVASETDNVDVPTVDVIGVRLDGSKSTIFSGLDVSQQDYDISSIDAKMFPYVQLAMRNSDSIHYTPYQLNYWRLTYDPVPEGAIAPNLYFSSKDTIESGEPYHFDIAFKNISDAAFDSVKVKMAIIDRNNIENIIPIPRNRPLLSNPDTIHVGSRIIPIGNLPGNNTVFVEVNPDDDQPEQYHFNNFVYRTLYAKLDSTNPLLDVTFDGQHILNRDIVSSKPEIVIKLKDEAKWLTLDDTSLIKIQVRYPNGELRRFYFNNSDTVNFIPAGKAPNVDNTASINLGPYFSQDGEYELIVSGKDKSENAAGNVEYRVLFQVVNKPMISNVLNYPNPFTTSTAFVFTITGSEVPQNLRIQILTITGKIVKDITKDELGPLKIGRNITAYKWDGTDQYGQKLANGVYLYRVITNLNGKSLDKYTQKGDNTDKYFNKGYGKMYLMR